MSNSPKPIVTRTGSIVRVAVEAPAGFVWTAGDVHELVSEARGGADATQYCLKDIRDRMAYGLEACRTSDCEWCEDNA